MLDEIPAPLERPVALHHESGPPGFFRRWYQRMRDTLAPKETPDGITIAEAKGGEPVLSLYGGARARRGWKKHFSPMTPAEFAAIMSADMPPGLRMDMHFSRAPYATWNSGIGHSGALFEDAPLQATRTFKFEKGKVDHSSFFIADRLQGRGTGRVFLANSMAVYRRIGIRSVTLAAGAEAGGYVWARFGFVPTRLSWHSLRESLSDELDEIERKLSPGDVALVRRMLDSDDPKTVWLIADLRIPFGREPLGRRLLAGQGWGGALDLTDPDAMARFDAYVRQEPRIAARPAARPGRAA